MFCRLTPVIITITDCLSRGNRINWIIVIFPSQNSTKPKSATLLLNLKNKIKQKVLWYWLFYGKTFTHTKIGRFVSDVHIHVTDQVIWKGTKSHVSPTMLNSRKKPEAKNASCGMCGSETLISQFTYLFKFHLPKFMRKNKKNID